MGTATINLNDIKPTKISISRACQICGSHFPVEWYDTSTICPRCRARLNSLMDNMQNSPCDGCKTNPKNGGSGICNCTLGTPQIMC